MNVVYLGLGSNIGDRLAYLNQAIKLLSENKSVDLIKKSSIYETEPWPKVQVENGRAVEEKQGWHLNQVIEIQTSLSPVDLLALTQETERSMGKEKKITWGSRIIDIDILLYNLDQVKTNSLTIPHPYISQRQFVMIPLLEINDQLVDPLSQKSYLESSRELGDDHTVKLYKNS